MNDTTDLSDTIKPKSDQLNADDLLTGPITVNVIDVKRGPKDQPVHIHINGQQPYKPCKAMRRVLIALWGSKGTDWIGKSMTLYCDPSVKFGGVELGGIRISHMSHINGVQNMMLTQSRGRKAQYIIKPLQVQDHTEIVNKYISASEEQQSEIWNTCMPDQQAAIHNAFNKQ